MRPWWDTWAVPFLAWLERVQARSGVRAYQQHAMAALRAMHADGASVDEGAQFTRRNAR